MSTVASPGDTHVSLDPNAPTAATTATTSPSSAASPSWTREWLKEDGSLDHKAFEKAPEELRSHAKNFERYKTADEFIKASIERESLLGKKGLIEPLPANATEAQKAERAALLRKVNGAPEKPEGYGLTRPPEVAENMWDQTYADSIASIAHKHGLPQAALKELAQAELAYTQRAIEENKKQEAAWFASQDKLIRESAQKEGLDYGKAKELAEKAGRKWGVDPSNPLMKNASAFMLLTRIGRVMGEDSLVTGDSGPLAGNLNLNADQAGAAAKDIQQNKQNPDYKAYWDPNDSRHQSVVDKVNSLLVIATRDKPRRGGR